ncbi:hypothetical protein TNCV_2970401 [Trichonephila clavipes]|nr:hypothetical protein TNCV_2970401 [Trichonephila clavipes]
MSSFETLCEASRRFIVLRSSEGFLSPSSSPVNNFRISSCDDSPVNNFRISSCDDSPVRWISRVLMALQGSVSSGVIIMSLTIAAASGGRMRASQIQHSFQWEFAFGQVYSEMQEKWVSGNLVNGCLRAVLEKLNSAHTLLAPSIA